MIALLCAVKFHLSVADLYGDHIRRADAQARLFSDLAGVCFRGL
ncbi:hypothetical protein [Campylobacter sp.]|nr:hypothetical protein [Campylobacter sp.]